MKTCETCGKVLNDSLEEYLFNGITQCKSCACQGHAHINSSVESNGSWAKILKAVGTVNIAIGVIASIYLGFIVYDITYEHFLTALFAAVVGIVLSVLSSSLLMAFAELSENISVIRTLAETKEKRKK